MTEKRDAFDEWKKAAVEKHKALIADHALGRSPQRRGRKRGWKARGQKQLAGCGRYGRWRRCRQQS